MLHIPIEIISWVASMAFPSAKTKRKTILNFIIFESSTFMGYDTVVGKYFPTF